MSHADAAESSAERAGAYLSTAENKDADALTRTIAAHNAQASATLAVAQRLGDLSDRLETIDAELAFTRSDFKERLADIESTLNDISTVLERYLPKS